MERNRIQQLATQVCSRVEAWLDEERSQNPIFCDKEALEKELHEAMRNADKKERKAHIKIFDDRRKALVADMERNARSELPALFRNFFSLFTDLIPQLKEIEIVCQKERQGISKLANAEKQRRCRIFYDGTGDDTYSNFKQHRFAIGSVGFMKGEQFFHVAKAMLCDDLASALKMMVTTGGPALRSLGRQVLNYVERGSSWEEVDTGLLLLVNIAIKLAQVQNISADSNAATVQLRNELRNDGVEGLYIVEGAKDDDRCGIGIHAEDPSVFSQIDVWGRNQLGHACMVIARHLGNETSRRDEVVEPVPVPEGFVHARRPDANTPALSTPEAKLEAIAKAKQRVAQAKARIGAISICCVCEGTGKLLRVSCPLCDGAGGFDD